MMSQCSHRGVPKYKMKNISENNRVVQLKLGTSIVPRIIHHMVHIIMLLWQHYWLQTLFSLNQILPFMTL